MNHDQYMQRCLDLALLGQSTVSPNPMVGAVIVLDDEVLGEGLTSPYGGPHAEVNAIQDVLRRYGEMEGKALLTKATVYVSLEPCAHYGKTPPCADMLVSMGVQKVVIGCLDTFAKVNGLGIQKLKEGSVDVVVGILEEACRDINRRFFTRIKQQRPYVILKWAETGDGYFASSQPEQRWITNKASKQLVHKWRSEEDAILIGKNTAIIDNPALTTRMWNGKSPKRILIDKNLEVSADHAIFAQDGVDVFVFNALKDEGQNHIRYIALENFDLYLPQTILYQLYLMDIQSLIVEGGAKTLQLFIDAGLWDEARVFTTQAEWGVGLRAPVLTSRKLKKKEKVSSDILHTYTKI
ncbi:bifunctional diaminohydroxyphosphoribosylaminopyrimidine deaminase/5-amino-6-(5-phosphoribosylamino)uracil reductase RibD [Sphingobacterium sp. SGG-5]|uniref:bifunctional diaminohydroxyphosphoribosylaminopyrimidine deaminase/5-amino-6-(5-phosphoribosylamino)uracil reductase RibD n=1 Tax=Sphingobacterium sp. SGG-5 TaxID=2710881 RepID=UPI0013EE296B|nr:bifunctional diaminohydroxyphosphoribosylaminopyrimidine deaminase/5-amino-6-(5-phosphoribosylamino)uracil reductase RibD [Sphingobacterium sp. SGG-5]NGM61509.1 bifunctional diaminohydroxyphosphoribosylaminopyrimidine deaminase/5-amino-6-(5-phosphoribosylamino)uracil reductase RibD [Sphingobacterium sp. SGG-5]